MWVYHERCHTFDLFQISPIWAPFLISAQIEINKFKNIRKFEWTIYAWDSTCLMMYQNNQLSKKRN